ncbi:hypothetical protein F4677DRAFT_189645 [Hypoxylon crocopeplum]|nr:hypothetical protein F4677DRAFT_189645 [Hypoxylon crocopeplum]
MPHATSSNITVTPLEHGPESKVNFGATITGVDLNDLDEPSFQAIREAIYRHNVVVVRDQHALHPTKQFEFMSRLDPAAPAKHSWLPDIDVEDVAGTTGKGHWLSIPGATGILVVGNGYQGNDHFGMKDTTIKATGHAKFHVEPLPKEEIDKGQTRFGYFHYDGIIHGSHPSRVTSLRCFRAPKGPDVTIRWDDGTGRTMKAQAGCTAFISCAQLYDLLTDEEKKMAENSYWEPAPHPFVWVGNRKFRNSGLGMAPGGDTVPLDKLPPWKAEDVHKYPMVWLNPVTGEKIFMILPDVVRKLYKKASPDAEVEVVESLDDIHAWLNDILDRICTPEYVAVPRYEEGDIVFFNNWGVLHSGIEYPDSYGTRTMHQCHIASSTPPVGPVPIA